MNTLSSVRSPENAIHYDVLSDDFRANPYPTFQWWHKNEGIFYDAQQKYWIAFKYDTVRKLLRDPALTVERYVESPSGDELVYDEKIREMLSIWMLNNDGERHKQARSSLIPLFTTRALADYEALIREQVASALDVFETNKGTTEIYQEVAFPLPARIIMSIMGLGELTENRLKDLQRYSDVISTYVGSAGRAPGCIKPTYDVLVEFCDLLMDSLANRPANFDKTLTARLIEVYGDGTTREELHATLSNIILFIVSGFETTTNLILNTFVALAKNPDLEGSLRDNPSLIDSFVEETLRIYPPVNRTARKAREAIEIDGVSIKSQDLVILFMGAANRDPEVFPDPDSFKLERPELKENQALSFGYGPHLCIGRMLSLLELRIFYQELLARFSSLNVDIDTLKWRDNSIFKGIQTLEASPLK